MSGIRLGNGILNDLGPLVWIVVVVVEWIVSVGRVCVERSVLTEVVHPAVSPGLVDHVVLDDVLHPSVGVLVLQVNYSHLNRA